MSEVFDLETKRKLKLTQVTLFETERTLIILRSAARIASEEMSTAADSLRAGNILRAIQLIESSRRRLDIAVASGIRTDGSLVEACEKHTGDDDGEDE
jgi:hypothetical protein